MEIKKLHMRQNAFTFRGADHKPRDWINVYFYRSLEGHLCICLYLTITVSVLICPEMANYHSCMYVINEMIYDVLLDM